MRRSGILMHITSLPGPGGIGSLGQEAYDFADFLQESGMKLWQVLPMGPTGYGESPYQSTSVFAGNPLLISTRVLREQGLLDYDFAEEYVPETDDTVNYADARASKEALLRKCFAQSEGKLKAELEQFVKETHWVADFALFTAVKQSFNYMMWTKWPDKGIRMREEASIAEYKEKLDEEIRYHIFCQYLFRRQWFALKKYCNERDIQLFGDMPIYVAEDSADTWTNPEVFQLDEDRVPARVAGVPPDLFSADGQLWGNPLYRWSYLQTRGYDWWVERMRGMQEMYDIVRVDHFIGFANYYSIPYGAPTSRTGRWIAGPGKHLFTTFRRELPGLNVVAEDLGVLNERVYDLLDFVGYPGMKVLSFGFPAGKDNPHSLCNWKENAVCYTGTHDNDTVLGWLKSVDKKTLKEVKETLGFTRLKDGPAAFIKCAMESVANDCVIPMQDILGLDGSARMNLPSTTGGNWLWRMKPGCIDKKLVARLQELNKTSKRGV
ncbi:MAG: 4-alpha-glucanotransferase [Clostridia bacterium]|nr:4-alpha-glucanotransferase [Clostridia bacterium]